MEYFVFIALLALCCATKVRQCEDENFDNLEESVILGDCDKPPCTLKKNTSIPISIQFVANEEHEDLSLAVTAKLGAVNLPFVGVDGKSACNNIFEEDGTTANGCKFEKDKKYLFKDNIEVLPIYPKIKTVVHWAIQDSTTLKHVSCFEVPVSITN